MPLRRIIPALLILPTSVVLSAALPSFGLADDAGASYGADGCYAGLGGSTQFLTEAEEQLDDFIDPSLDVDESMGLHARLGCMSPSSNGVLGFDLHFEWIEGFKIDLPGNNSKAGGYAISAGARIFPLRALDNAIDSYPPILRRIQPYGYVGGGYLNLDGIPERNASDFIGRVGGGFEVFVTEHIAVAVDATYVLPGSDSLENADYLSLGWGAVYYF